MHTEQIFAAWPAPVSVQARVTTRVSGEDASLQQLPCQWVEQVHGTVVHRLEQYKADVIPQADAIYTQLAGIICGIRTADCLPVFFCDRQGQEIAVAHAGWRGLAAGVLENTLQCFQTERSQLLVWFGPAIGPCHFEVGDEVREIYIQAAEVKDRADTAAAFSATDKQGRWMADIYALARIRLQSAGVEDISGGGLCTYCDPEYFYSHRRARDSGRMTSLIHIS